MKSTQKRNTCGRMGKISAWLICILPVFADGSSLNEVFKHDRQIQKGQDVIGAITHTQPQGVTEDPDYGQVEIREPVPTIHHAKEKKDAKGTKRVRVTDPILDGGKKLAAESAHGHGGPGGLHFEGPAGELEEHAIAEYIIAPIAVAIIISLFLGATLERLEVTWFPESACTLIVGVFLGIYMKFYIGAIEFFNNEEVFNKTCSTLLTLFLLPILIFESGFSLRFKDFASQFDYILLFAIIGSLISFLVVGLLILFTGEQYLGLHSIGWPRTAFAYASLIAATDPVATLATYSKLKVDPLLNIMVWGDSTFNDAVAIVLFKVLNDDTVMGKPGTRPGFYELCDRILTGIGVNMFGSLFVGVAAAMLFLLTMRLLHMRHAPRLEILALVAMAFANFAIAEAAHLSGIVATMFSSIFLGIYARPHLSRNGTMLATFFLKQLSCLMDTSVFLLTGFCVVSLGATGVKFGCLAMLFCLVGRAAAVFPVGLCVNAIKRWIGRGQPTHQLNLLTKNHMFMMWHAGLRGAISLTLCMQLGEWVDILDGEGTRHILQLATYCLILVFLFVFGGSTEACLKKLSIPIGHDTDPDALYQSETPGSIKAFLDRVDGQIMTPLFVGTDVESKGRGSNIEEDVEAVLDRAAK